MENGRFPSMTLVLKTGLSRLNRSQFPKHLPTSPRHKQQNHRRYQTTLPTTSATALPDQGDAKTAVLPSKTSATTNGRSQPTRPSSPKPTQPTCDTTTKTAAVASPFAENVCANPAGQRLTKTSLYPPKPAPQRKR
jgi:hypothetical protein